MAISTAVGLDRRSTIIGYQLAAGNFASTTPFLPQSILVIGQANSDKISGLTANEIVRLNTVKEVGDMYGYGSPMHRVMRILKPNGSDGVGGIPVFFGVQDDSGLTASTKEITITGTATGASELEIMIGGRTFIDGKSLTVNIAVGDTPDVIMGNIRDAINNCTSCEYSATFVSGTDTKVTCTSKFKGLNSNVSMALTLKSAGSGVTIATTVAAGSGVATVTSTLDNIGDRWIPMVINTYSAVSTAVLSELQIYNGMPGDPSTGRYSGTIMKPFVAFTGVCSQAEINAWTGFAGGALNQNTNSAAPAFGSAGSCYEAAANVALLESVLANNNPSLDVIEKTMIDMPAPSVMSLANPTYDQRDIYLKAGLSTCVFDASVSAYRIKDLITTYRVETEVEPSFRWVRDVYIDFNLKFAYYLVQETQVIGKVIIADNQAIPSANAGNVINTKVFKSLVLDLIDDMISKGLITDRDFTKASLQVEIDSTNPNRFNCRFDYKRTGIARISSTNVLAGHFFGN